MAMQLSGIEVVRLRASGRTTYLFLVLRSDDGVAGTAEASMSLDDAAVAAHARRLFNDWLRDRPVSKWGVVIADLTKAVGREPPIDLATAVSALEQALLDLRAQQLGVPLTELLGGARRESITLYANLNRGILDRSPEGFAEAASAAVSAGFTTVKVAPFDEVIPRRTDDFRTALSLGLERVTAVRSVVGEQRELLIDCHGRFTVEEALLVARELGPHGVAWFEEPIPTTSTLLALSGLDSDQPVPTPDDLTAIRKRSPLPLASGEYVYGLRQAVALIDEFAPDYLMPDVKHCGGALTASRISALCEAIDVRVSLHNPSGPIATMASGHVAASAHRSQLLEYAFGDVPWRKELTLPEEPVRGGLLSIPSGPGLGLELNDDVVREHRIPVDA